MISRESSDGSRRIAPAEKRFDEQKLHPSWRAFIRYCTEIGHGEIELLKIQDGLPVVAEKIKRKVRFP